MKKGLRQTQTLRAKNFRPMQTTFSGTQDRQNLMSEMVITCTYRPSLVKIDAYNFELLW